MAQRKRLRPIKGKGLITGAHPSRSLAEGKMGRIIEKCTMTNPSRRYRDTLQLMEALL